MLSIYRYIYYRFYLWNWEKGGQAESPRMSGVYFVSFVMLLNAYSIIIFLNPYTEFDLLNAGMNPGILAVSLMLMIIVVNYFQYVWQGKTQQIVEQYEDEDQATRKKKLLGIIAYVVSSILLNIGLISVFRH